MLESFPVLYTLVPKIACKGKCTEACGPIMAYPREEEYFERTTGRKFPDALKMLKEGKRDCPYLNALGRCDVYESRPLVCRLFGVVPEMPCPFGCVAERMLSGEEGHRLMRATQ